MKARNWFFASFTACLIYGCAGRQALPPTAAPPSAEMSAPISKRVLIKATINRQGEIESLQIFESSGDSAVDQRALEKARGMQIPPPPASTSPGAQHFIVRIPIQVDPDEVAKPTQ